MSIFFKKNQNKIETACACKKETRDIKDARFIVLGTCCKKCTQTFENTKQAVKELGLNDKVEHIGDSMEIAKYGVMSTPALVMDGNVISMGQLLKVEDVKHLIEKAGTTV